MPELSMIRRNHKEIEIGAAITISKVIAYLKQDDNANSSPDGKLVFQKIANHMEKIASGFIRNSASIGGNLVMAQRKGFPSDVATILLAAGSTVGIMTTQKHERLTLEEFLARPPISERSVLLSIQVPFLEPETSVNIPGSGSKLDFETYRAAPRPLGNALPYLNAAFLADVSPHVDGVVVNKIRLAFGAYGTKHATRASTVEEYLSGKILSVRVLYEAIKLVQGAVVPESGTSHAAYRTSLAASFLFQFLSPYVKVVSSVSSGLSNGFSDGRVVDSSNNHSDGSIGQLAKSTLLSSAKQDVKAGTQYYPVGEPMTSLVLPSKLQGKLSM